MSPLEQREIVAGSNLQRANFTVTPFGALQYDVLDRRGFTESGINGGSNAIGLSYPNHIVDSLPMFYWRAG